MYLHFAHEEIKAHTSQTCFSRSHSLKLANGISTQFSLIPSPNLHCHVLLFLYFILILSALLTDIQMNMFASCFQ